MNPSNVDTYIHGLHKTLKDKLFFLNSSLTEKLGEDFFSNKIIIDFGCGDGSVLKYIIENTSCENSYFIAIDQDERMYHYTFDILSKAGVGATVSRCLENILPTLKSVKCNREVVFIATSVLHELGDYQYNVYKFVSDYCDYFIVRDMFIREVHPYYLNNDKPDKYLMSKIIANSNTKHLCQFIEKYDLSVRSMIHYLLKYTYVENWETELQEDYLSVDISGLRAYLSPFFDDLHVHTYVQKWRADQVEKDFGIDLNSYIDSTHIEFILKRRKS